MKPIQMIMKPREMKQKHPNTPTKTETAQNVQIWQRLTDIQRSVLIHGYVRKIVIIPKDLIQLILLFYNDIIDWKFKKADLEEFYQCENAEGFNSSWFEINDIPFYLAIYPNGLNARTEGYTEMLLISPHQPRPDIISSFTIYLELFNFETKYQFRKLVKCRINKDSPCSHSIQWYPYALKLSDLDDDDYTELNFAAYVEIMNIEYFPVDTEEKEQSKAKLERKVFARPVVMITECEYRWKLDEDEMDIFMANEVDSSLYSPNFNGDCWCIVLIPYGWNWSSGTEGHLFAKIKLLKLPYGVKSIDIKSEFVVRSDAVINGWIYEKKCDVRTPGLVDIKQRIPTEKFQSFTKELMIIAKMTIVKVFDFEDKEIPKKEWINYGIMEYKNYI